MASSCDGAGNGVVYGSGAADVEKAGSSAKSWAALLWGDLAASLSDHTTGDIADSASGLFLVQQSGWERAGV